MDILRLFLLAIVGTIGVSGCYFWYLAYQECNQDRKAIMMTPFWIIFPEYFSEKGKRYRKKFILVTIAACM